MLNRTRSFFCLGYSYQLQRDDAMAQSESSDFQTESFNNYAESDIEYQNTSRDSKDSITEFNSNSEDAAEKELLARLHRVLQLQKSTVGLLFASTQILNDWEKLDEIGLHLGDWTMRGTPSIWKESYVLFAISA